jgi:hypothetical protein
VPACGQARITPDSGSHSAGKRLSVAIVRLSASAGAGPISSSLALASTAFTTCEFSK